MADNGFDTVPDRYTGEGRETCDRMRDFLGDEGFAAACASNVIKYTDRRGRKKTPAEVFVEKTRAFVVEHLPAFVQTFFGLVVEKSFAVRTDDEARFMRDMEKAWWWCRMYLHVQGEADDPRARRPGFAGYSKPVDAVLLDKDSDT
jgi:hypothetical protein